MKIIIYTSFDCLIKSDSWEETLDENQHLTLDEKPLTLAVYPIGKSTRIPFQIDFNQNSATYYRIIEKEDKLLVFLLDGIISQSIKIHSLSCEGKRCVIEVSKNKVSFACSDNKKVVTLPDEIITSKCGHFYHIAYAKLEGVESNYLIACNVKSFGVKAIKGDKIELTKDGFIVTSSPQGYKQSTEEYIITKEGLKIKDRQFISALSFTPEQTLAYQFMNSVKLGDFSSALSMLSAELNQNLSTSALKEYFGTLSYIFPLDQSTCFAISNNENVIYSFTILKNKITEISDNKS